MGLRELKKQKTRKSISDLATRLFIKRGYHEVTMADVAAEAEVSLKTVFNYFPKKEALVFDIEDELDAGIQTAIRNRDKGQSILDALHSYFLDSPLFAPVEKQGYTKFMKLVNSTPELSAYLRGMMVRYESTLAKELRANTGLGKLEAECLSRMVLEGVTFARSTMAREEALELVFAKLKGGWGPGL